MLAEAEAVLPETAEAPAIADAITTVAEAAPEPVQAASEVAELTGEVTVDADAVDEALLDAIAMEMGAPDPISEDEIAAAVAEQSHADEPAPVEPEVVPAAPLPQPIVPPPAPATIQTPAPVVTEAVPAPAVEMSLGSSILASGMLRKPVVAANDPLAPIRRMSQAEKIAFFS
jgi:hypothetical protein